MHVLFDPIDLRTQRGGSRRGQALIHCSRQYGCIDHVPSVACAYRYSQPANRHAVGTAECSLVRPAEVNREYIEAAERRSTVLRRHPGEDIGL